MKWYYVEDGQQAGPFDDSQFRQLVEKGTIRADTLVWREGMAEWLPYQKVFEGTEGVGGQPPQIQGQAVGPDHAACVECGGVFKTDEMISYGTARVCAACKPVFLQKLAEGVPVRYSPGKRPMPVDADALVEEVLSRDYYVDIGSCVSRGWRLVKANFGITVGATFLVMMCIQASGFIPILGVILAMIVQGPLNGGLNLFYLKLIRGEPANLGDAFSGFSKKFWPLCGTFVLMIVLAYAWLIPAALAAIPAFRSHSMPGPLVWVFGSLGLIGLMWVVISFMFALPLCADLELGPWTALRTSFRVVSKHWFAVFGLVFVAGLISMLGIVACFVGVIATLPIFYAATLYAYEDIFGVRS